MPNPQKIDPKLNLQDLIANVLFSKQENVRSCGVTELMNKEEMDIYYNKTSTQKLKKLTRVYSLNVVRVRSYSCSSYCSYCILKYAF